MMSVLPRPAITPLTAPYWAALNEGRLTYQCCQDCGHRWLPPREECPGCLGPRWEWEQAGGRGRLVSWVVYRVAYHEALRERLPYNVAVVELVEGPRLITSIPDRPDGAGLYMDAPVSMVAVDDGAGQKLAMFRLEETPVPT